MRVFEIWLSLIIFFVIGLADNWSAEPEVRFNLLTLPSSRQAELRLAMPARLNYQHAPMRQCVSQLAEHFQFSYWIDRRVDADKPLTIEVTNQPLHECLSQLAKMCDAQVGLVENVVTIAHPEPLAAMQYAAIRLHNQLSIQVAASTEKTPNAQLKPLSWPALTTPMELSQILNSTWGLNLEGNLPHDLMNAGALQPCTVATQLTLLFGGFDRCAAGNRLGELKVLAIPKPGNWQAIYPASSVSQEQLQKVKEVYKEMRAERSGSTWTIVGSTSAHQQLLQPALSSTAKKPSRNTPASRGSKSSTDPLASQRFDISKQADKPLGAILKNLGEQLGLTIQWASDLPPAAPHTLVTIEAKKAKLDEILSGLATQAELSIVRDGTSVSVSKKDAAR